MAVGPNPTVSNIFQQLGAFLQAVLPSGYEVLQAQPNRVPEPKTTAFVLMSPPTFTRLRTNIVSYQDAVFTGSVTGNVLDITFVGAKTPDAQLAVGSTIFGNGLPGGGAIITALGTGTGQLGTYTINGNYTIPSETISAGTMTMEMGAKAVVQLDFHANDPRAGDMANIISTAMRDGYAVDQFANQSPNFGVVPLYADDARQAPFLNDQQQIEWRYVVEAAVQANITVSVPLQYADSVALTLKDVEAIFPFIPGQLLWNIAGNPLLTSTSAI